MSDSDPAGVPHLTDSTVTGFRGRGLMISKPLSSRLGWYTTTTAKHIDLTMITLVASEARHIPRRVRPAARATTRRSPS
ncbi:hypothetical protein GCM10009848_53090 [Micromonospora lupini]|uniref:Uncharacterized protein n=2 Tax=Micromonospora lupini TaxID=285679 RepID=I0L7P0_9ACTN|nr:Protein of unknown function [Micromonospora lupini str. Lupac 08]